jgi:hypothetical protein
MHELEAKLEYQSQIKNHFEWQKYTKNLFIEKNKNGDP